jgi:putative phosphoribosyl transferase
MRFRDRQEAGRLLAEEVARLGLDNPIVLALPRGGVPVAGEIARRLGARLDVFVARKIGAPHHPELGIGAIAEGDEVVADVESLTRLRLATGQWDGLVARERAELARRVRIYRRERERPNLAGRDVVLVDDGIATGVTAEAALRSLGRLEPRRLVLAVPVCARETAERLRSLADDVVYVTAPEHLRAVGQWYRDFGQITDDEVLGLLDQAAGPVPK